MCDLALQPVAWLSGSAGGMACCCPACSQASHAMLICWFVPGPAGKLLRSELWSVLQWFKSAGFQDVKIKRIGPSWYRGVRRHGLIMGCSVTGTKAQVLSSALHLIWAQAS